MAKYPYSDSSSIDQKILTAREKGDRADVCKVGEAMDIYYNLALSFIDRPVNRVLDTGCYQGAFTARLQRETGAQEAVGIDASAESIAVARERFPDVSFIAGDVESTPLPGQFDYIYAMGWLHVKPLDAIERTLGKMIDALAPGGRMIITGGYKNWADVKFDDFKALVDRHLALVLDVGYEKHREYAPEGLIRFSARHYLWMLERP